MTPKQRLQSAPKSRWETSAARKQFSRLSRWHIPANHSRKSDKRFGRERRAARTTQRAKIGLKRRGAHAFQAVASHGATERAARAPERSHGRNRRAQSHSAVAGPRRRAGRAAAAAQERRLGRLSPGWERLLAWQRATSPMRTQSRAARGMLLGPV